MLAGDGSSRIERRPSIAAPVTAMTNAIFKGASAVRGQTRRLSTAVMGAGSSALSVGSSSSSVEIDRETAPAADSKRKTSGERFSSSAIGAVARAGASAIDSAGDAIAGAKACLAWLVRHVPHVAAACSARAFCAAGKATIAAGLVSKASLTVTTAAAAAAELAAAPFALPPSPVRSAQRFRVEQARHPSAFTI